MNRPLLRTSVLPGPGTYRAGHATGEHLDAVALVSLRTAAGPVHLRTPVLAASVCVQPDLRSSWLEVDLHAAAVRSSLPQPVRRMVDPRIGRALGAVRLETFALQETGANRFRAHTDLYAAGGVTEVVLDVRLVEVGASSLRLLAEARLPRTALGLDLPTGVASATARLSLALHAAAVPAEQPAAAAPDLAGASA